MRTTIGQTKNRVWVQHHFPQRLKVTIGVAQQWHIQNPFTLALQHSIVSKLGRVASVQFCLSQNALVRAWLIVNRVAEREHIAPCAQRLREDFRQTCKIWRVIEYVSPQTRLSQRRYSRRQRQLCDFLIGIMQDKGMSGALKTEQHTSRALRYLWCQRTTGGSILINRGEQALPLVRVTVILQTGKRHRPARFLTNLAHPRQLFFFRIQVASHF